jgi:hypothetical protein
MKPNGSRQPRAQSMLTLSQSVSRIPFFRGQFRLLRDVGHDYYHGIGGLVAMGPIGVGGGGCVGNFRAFVPLPPLLPSISLFSARVPSIQQSPAAGATNGFFPTNPNGGAKSVNEEMGCCWEERDGIPMETRKNGSMMKVRTVNEKLWEK